MTARRVAEARLARLVAPPRRRLEVSCVTAAWLGWAGLTIVLGVVVDYGLALVGFRGTDLALVAFGAGLAWSAATPRVLRLVWRWIHA